MLLILGTRGIPARHGGFETFAERLALHLRDRWTVAVACQGDGPTEWRGIRLLRFPSYGDGSLGSILFDLHSVLHALHERPTVLTLGYNTAIFGTILRMAGITNIINMDGIEWRRAKWSAPIKAWFRLNERIAGWTATHLVADHPEIARHLERHNAPQRITTIAYGSDELVDADAGVLGRLGLQPYGYALVVARPEPENSPLEIVSAFSQRARGVKLVVLGEFRPDGNPYHAAVMQAAGPDVLFPGAIYDPVFLAALRVYARLYIHGHQVGGTNPSLVEALGAGCAVLAHDNRFNKWVAGDAMMGFLSQSECAAALDVLLDDSTRLAGMREAARRRHAEYFCWGPVLAAYESTLHCWTKSALVQPVQVAL